MENTKRIDDELINDADMGATDGHGASVFPRIAALLFLLLGAGGLFLGCLGTLNGLSLFSHDFLKLLVFGSQSEFSAFDSSLLGIIISYCKALQAGGAAMFSWERTIELVPLALFALLALAIVLSLVFAVLSFAMKDRAEKFAFASGVLVTLAYAALFLYVYCVTCYLYPYASSLSVVFVVDFYRYDAPLGAIACLSFLLLLVHSIRRAGKAALLNALLFALTVCLAFAFFAYSSTVGLLAIMVTPSGTHELFPVASVLFVAVLALVFVVSLVRLSSKKRYGVMLCLYTLLFVAAVFLIIAGIALPIAEDRWQIFKNQTDLLILCSLVCGAFAGQLLSAIAMIVTRRKNRLAEEYEEYEEDEEDEEPVPEVVEEIPEAVEPVPAVAEEPVPEVVEEPAAEVPETSAEPAVAETAEERAPEPAAPAQPAQPVQQPAQQVPMGQPVYVYTPMPMAPYPPVQPSAAQPAGSQMSEFERRMEALARGIEPQEPEYRPIPKPAPVFPTPPAAARPVAAPVQTSISVYESQYTYDSFLNGLTPQEKNEFGDLFIGMRYGSFGLPVYVIGGNNEEFFRKVFIYLGRFRSHISPELLGKLYAYVNRT